jgi:hypothetical protein
VTCPRCEGYGWAAFTDEQDVVRYGRCECGVEPVRGGPAPQPEEPRGLDGDLHVTETCVMCHRNRAMPMALVCPPCWDHYWRRVLRTDAPPGPPRADG